MFGFDDYIYGLIEEAKSPEEIKKLLNYQFVQGKGVPERVLDAVFDIDPTKKKSYTRWTLMQWEKYGIEILKALSDGRLKKMFDTFKKREADGLNLANMENFEKAMEYIPDADPILDKEGDPNAPENQFDIMFESNEWVVAVPHTYEASEKLGRGCRWCTAGYFGDGPGYYKRYSSYGPLWVNFDKRSSEIARGDHKEYPYTRYQFLFEWQNWHGELMDSNDDRIDFSDIDVPQDVVEFYGEQNEKYAEIIENGPERNMTYEEYMDERNDLATTIISCGNYDRYLVLAPEQNDEYDLENVPWLLYDEEDMSDSPFPRILFDVETVFAERFDEQNDCPLAVLRTTSQEECLVYYNSNNTRYGDWELTKFFEKFDCGDNKFFVDTVNNNAIVVNKHSGKAIILNRNRDGDVVFPDDDASYITDIWRNKDIESFISKNQIYGYEGMFFEIKYEENKHGLLYISYNGNDFEMIVHKDKPYGNAEQFEPYLDGDTLCVKGSNWSYNLGDTGSNYNIEEDFGEYNDSLCGVKSKNGYNIYNKRNGKCVFETDCANITYFYSECICYALVTHKNSERFFYDVTNEKQVPFVSDSISRLSYGYDIWKAHNDGGWLVISFCKEQPLIFGPYAQIGFLNRTFVAFKNNDNKLNIIDAITGRMMLPQDVDGLSLFRKRDESKWIIAKMGSESTIFNFYNGKAVLRGVNENFRPITFGQSIWLAQMSDEKFVLMEEDFNPLGTSFQTFHGQIYTSSFAIEDNQKMYVVALNNGLKLLPTKDGIDLSKATFVEIVDQGYFPKKMMFRVGNYLIQYNPFANSPSESIRIMGTEFSNGEIPNDIKSQIFSIFYPSVAKVQNDFKDTLNKMLDTEKEE